MVLDIRNRKSQAAMLLGIFVYHGPSPQQKITNIPLAIEVRPPFAYNSGSLKTMVEALSQWN